MRLTQQAKWNGDADDLELIGVPDVYVLNINLFLND